MESLDLQEEFPGKICLSTHFDIQIEYRQM